MSVPAVIGVDAPADAPPVVFKASRRDLCCRCTLGASWLAIPRLEPRWTGLMPGTGIGLGGGGGGGVAAQSAAVSATATGILHSLTRLLGGSSILGLLTGSSAYLTLSGLSVRATAAFGAGNSQVALVRETSGQLAVEYPLTLTGRGTIPDAPPVAATPLPKQSPIFDRISADTLTGLSDGAKVPTWASVNGDDCDAGDRRELADLCRQFAGRQAGDQGNGYEPGEDGRPVDGVRRQQRHSGRVDRRPGRNAFVFHAAGAGIDGQRPVFTRKFNVDGGTANWVSNDGARVGSYNDDTPSGLTAFHPLMVIRDNAPGQTPHLRYVINGMAASISNVTRFGNTI